MQQNVNSYLWTFVSPFLKRKGLKKNNWPGAVAQACNLRYLEDGCSRMGDKGGVSKIPFQPMAGHSGMLLSSQIYREAQIGGP
jgi:hypothetical protein